MDDRRFEGRTVEQAVAAVPDGAEPYFASLADTVTITDPEHPIMVGDLRWEPDRHFRVTPAALHSVEYNLTISTMDREDVADGVFRGCRARHAGPTSRHNVPMSAIDDLLNRARARLNRVAPESLAAEVAAGALVVDTRPVEQRERDGALPGAVVVDRNVLEWRLDPTSAHRLPVVTGADQRIIVVCNEGYSSSLAAATLQDLGLRRATDLTGGYQAWLRHRARR